MQGILKRVYTDRVNTSLKRGKGIKGCRVSRELIGTLRSEHQQPCATKPHSFSFFQEYRLSCPVSMYKEECGMIISFLLMIVKYF